MDIKSPYRIKVVKNLLRGTTFFPQFKQGLFGWAYLWHADDGNIENDKTKEVQLTGSKQYTTGYKTKEEAMKIIDLHRADNNETVSYIVNC